MQNNFPKMPLLFSFLFLLFSCLVFFYFYREIDDNNTAYLLAEQAWHNETLRRDEIKALERSIKTIEKEKVQLETHFAQGSDIVPFLDTIEGLGSQTGIIAEVVAVDISEDQTGLLVGMKVSGSFEGLYKFLTLLENSPYELEFVAFNIRKENSQDAVWDAIFQIKLLSFVK
ncbi:hypothetical protein A2818_02715 [Candidatus Nomurabacteria bacterium RIFCSPHIGHO2_01_FULL_40_12]|uniref:Uncharacterized protein n=1 Tax=Candidatus Nomurabacteria bacterium RIFCSPHIGHO2_01_FULL_40_12 TaxID=1801737 RepID=A0A1F6UZ34_9BACT|nr:MAG: hypothetical protein A2818_02715 [Candidatus Nomurabacteria bacterium RIFCSPHIGHO2_01_FULL_40_12]